MSPDRHASDADLVAARAVAAGRPRWVGMGLVRDVPEVPERTLLHAGPPFAGAAAMPVPVRNSAVLACVYEGWADSATSAADLLHHGEVRLAPAQDHALVVPLAGVASPSMAVHVVRDAEPPHDTAYAVVNEGQDHALRLGRLDTATVPHHRWLNGPFTEWLAVAVPEPVELLPLMAAALAEGDDCHSRTVTGTASLAGRLVATTRPPDDVARFLDRSPAFALNLWMGAAAVLLGRADGIADSGVVVKAGGNGVDFGIQVAGAPGDWITVPADPPVGGIEPPGHAAVGALGDSAVVDLLGLGGQCAHAGTPHRCVPLHRQPTLDAPVAVGVRECLDNGVAPTVLLGMIDRDGYGRIGGGAYRVPMTLLGKAFRRVLT